MNNISNEITALLGELPSDLYEGRENLELVFSVQSGETKTDSAGNSIPVEGVSVVKAIAKRDDRNIPELEQVGPDINSFALICRCVTPLRLPENVGLSYEDRVPAAYSDNRTSYKKRGEFFLIPAEISVVAGSLDAIGQQFEGIFLEANA